MCRKTLLDCLPLQEAPRHTKRTESNAEQQSGRSRVRRSEDQLVLSHLSMIAIASQIENAHAVKAVVVGHVVRDTRDKRAKSIVGISAFTFQPPNRRLQGCRAGVTSCSNGVVVSEKRVPLAKFRVEKRRSPGNAIRIATRSTTIDGSLADSVIVGRAGVEILIRFQAEGFEAVSVVGCRRLVAHRAGSEIW